MTEYSTNLMTLLLLYYYYFQILVAIVMLIIAYGLHERYSPYQTDLLNNLEAMVLFVLIVTQIFSISYLYLDQRAKRTGDDTSLMTLMITLVLCVINIGAFAFLLFFLARGKLQEAKEFVQEHFCPTTVEEEEVSVVTTALQRRAEARIKRGDKAAR